MEELNMIVPENKVLLDMYLPKMSKYFGIKI